MNGATGLRENAKETTGKHVEPENELTQELKRLSLLMEEILAKAIKHKTLSAN